MTPNPSRMTRSHAFLLLVAAVVVAAVTPARAKAQVSESVQAKPAPTASQPTKADADQAKAVIEETLARYRALKTYQDKTEMCFNVVMRDADGDDVGEKQESAGSLLFAATRRFAAISQQMSLYCDGQTLWKYAEFLSQYIESPVAEQLDLTADESLTAMGGPFGVHPLLPGLVHPDKPLSELFPMIKEFTRVAPETKDGQPGRRVFAKLETEDFPYDKPLAISLWIADETLLVGEIRVDMTDFYREMMSMQAVPWSDEEEEQPTVEKAEAVVRFVDVVVDADIPAERFVFKPGEDDKKVKEFAWPGSRRGDQLKLVGKPAPAFAGEDLDGKPLSLADFRGRVVVLDFWATWCGPCVQAMPHLQKVAEKYADKPVTVIGVNRDSQGAEKKIRNLLEEKKTTFRQLMDPEGDVAEKYEVTGIPQTVLIDTQGVVQDVRIGFTSGIEEDLSAGIEKLLKGEPIYTADELAEMIADSTFEEDEEAGEGETVSANLEDFAPERLVEGSVSRMQASGYSARRADVDGDGRPELLLPDWRGSLYVVSGDGSEVERVRFKGQGLGTSVTAVEPVRIKGGLHWLTAYTRHSGMGMKQRAQATLYGPDGSALWTFQPDLPADTSSQMVISAGDLDGDEIPEFAIGMMVFKMKERSGGTWTWAGQEGYLVILNADGQRIAQRRAGAQVHLVHVAPADKAGDPGTVLYLVDTELRRFQLRPAGEQPGRQPSPDTTE